MQTLTALIPDVEVLVGLSEMELGETVLQLAKEHCQYGKVHYQSIGSQIDGQIGGENGYPQNRRHEAKAALSEAWNWLIVHGLLIPDHGGGVSSGWMMLSRRAESLIANRGYRSYMQSVGFPKSLMHPFIADEVWIDLARGDLGTAVFKAFRAVEIAVRICGGFADTDVGTQLMRKAFDINKGPLTDYAQPEAEREALAHLFTGSIGSYKNPHSHRTVSLSDTREAQEMVMLASHLLRIVDSRKKR